MSIFDWFSRKKPDITSPAPESSGLGYVDATVPVLPADRLNAKFVLPPVNHAANRRSERLERRELLYSVVRDTMIRAGILAASYKFKVLSLDARGGHYLVMMDLANLDAGDTGRLSEIEAILAQTAKVRHDILVTAVYWRMNEHITAGLSRSQSVSASQAAKKTPEVLATHPSAAPAPLARHIPAYEPLQQSEVAAFKLALESAAPAVSLSASGQIVTSGRRNPAPSAEFEDTQILKTNERASPLSGTQFGDLN